MHIKLFVYTFSCLFTFQLFVYIFSYLFTFSAICFSAICSQFQLFVYFYRSFLFFREVIRLFLLFFNTVFLTSAVFFDFSHHSLDALTESSQVLGGSRGCKRKKTWLPPYSTMVFRLFSSMFILTVCVNFDFNHLTR